MHWCLFCQTWRPDSIPSPRDSHGSRPFCVVPFFIEDSMNETMDLWCWCGGRCRWRLQRCVATGDSTETCHRTFGEWIGNDVIRAAKTVSNDVIRAAMLKTWFSLRWISGFFGEDITQPLFGHMLQQEDSPNLLLRLSHMRKQWRLITSLFLVGWETTGSLLVKPRAADNHKQPLVDLRIYFGHLQVQWFSSIESPVMRLRVKTWFEIPPSEDTHTEPVAKPLERGMYSTARK